MRKTSALILALLLGFPAAGFSSEALHKIKITVAGKTINGVLDDNLVANQIYGMLPFRLSLTELGGREKYGDLPDNVTARGLYTDVYHPGDIGYWSPGNQMAFYYHDDGQRVPSPGIITIGHFDASGYRILTDSSTRTLLVERVDN